MLCRPLFRHGIGLQTYSRYIVGASTSGLNTLRPTSTWLLRSWRAPYATGAEAGASFEDHGLSTKKFLEKAYKDGALHIRPEQIGVFLGALSSSGERLTATTLRNVCAQQGISIDAAYTLARLLVRSPGQLDKYQGRQILLQASQLGSAKATLHIVKTAVVSNQLDKDEVQPALNQLKKLLDQEPPIVPALVAGAKVCEAEGDLETAEHFYKSAIGNVPAPEKSRAARLSEGLKSRYSPERAERSEERKITVEENDIELDVVAAHVGLARILLQHGSQHDEAVKHLEIAALEYDDPAAYFELARHYENVARDEHVQQRMQDDPLDHDWMRFVPYKWFEYTMKATVSGHAEASYKIGLFYGLQVRGWGSQIADVKLRQMMQENPMMKGKRNQIDTVEKWFMCAAHAGYTSAYLLARFVHLLESSGHMKGSKEQAELYKRVAQGAPTNDFDLGHVKWTGEDQQLALSLANWIDQNSPASGATPMEEDSRSQNIFER